MDRVSVKPDLLRWARERSGLAVTDLPKFKHLAEWERGVAQPTLRQLEAYAKATHTPVGFLFLAHPPTETLPLPDMRTLRDEPVRRPSPNLLDMVYVCQQRQAWFQEFARAAGHEPLTFVGSATVRDSIETVAAAIRKELGFDLDARRDFPTWTEALRQFITQAEEIGVLVMCSGVVLNNTHRKLDPDEFRGFAIADPLAPLVFINGADGKAAQMFTLAHELAHIWLGKSAVTDATAGALPDDRTERWSNQVAAELLVPLDVLRAEFNRRADVAHEAARLAKRFKVSTLVVIRRLHDMGAFSKSKFHEAYEDELKRIRKVEKGSGGNFYLTQPVRASKRFTRALVASVLEGQTLFRDALQMLGISKFETFRELGSSLGVA